MAGAILADGAVGAVLSTVTLNVLVTALVALSVAVTV